jgi:peptide/nickel transport system permease protein
MTAFIVRRFIGLIAVLFAITVLVFLMFFATPGVDPSSRLAGRNPSPETVAAVKHEFGLDRPLPVQYLLMMKRLFISRDLVSYGNQSLKVVPAITSAAPVTFSLVFGAAMLWVVGSILLGVLAVVLKGTIFDPLLMILALIGISMPVFWLAEMMNLITQDRLHDTFLFSWVPPLGYVPLTQDPWQWFLHLIIPWITLSVGYIGFYARVLRANLLETQNEDYIRTAWAKGLSPRRVLLKHMLRASMITFVSLFGLDLAFLIGGGAIVTEYIFGLPGIGRLTYNSVVTLDLPVIMAVVIYGAFFITIISALVDIRARSVGRDGARAAATEVVVGAGEGVDAIVVCAIREGGELIEEVIAVAASDDFEPSSSAVCTSPSVRVLKSSPGFDTRAA